MDILLINADLGAGDRHALPAAIEGFPSIVPGLLAWIDFPCDCEMNRRRGLDYPLQPPEAAIDPSEDEVSINATVVLRVASTSSARPMARL